MTIHEMLSKLDANDIKVQFVDECLSDVRSTKKCTKATIETDAITPTSVVSKTYPVGVILWVPRDVWRKTFWEK